MKGKAVTFFCVFLIILSLFVLIFSTVYVREEISHGQSYTSAKAMCVMESTTKRVLDSKNENAKLPMASTTKIMTAITAIESGKDLDSPFEILPKAVGISGTSLYLRAGEVFTLRDLLYGLMLISGNDASVAIGEHCGGNLANFVDMMNNKAKEIDANSSHFDNTHGLDSKNHYTTAHDLALITSYAMQNPTFKEIVSTKNIKITNSDGKSRYLKNKNKLLSTLDGANGVKTGYTTASGKCFVGGAKRGGMQLICVVLNRGDMWQKAADLLEYGFAHYEPTLVGRSDVPLFDYEYGGERIQLRLAEDVVLPTEKGERAELGWEFVPVERVEKGFAAGDTVGFVRFWQGNRLIFEAKTVTIKAISNKGATSLRGLAAEDTIDWKGLTSISPLAASPREGAPTY